MNIDDIFDYAREIARFSSAADALEWDQQTGLPSAGGDYRAEQIAALRTHSHRLATDADYGRRLDDAPEPDDATAAGNLRVLRRDYQRQCRLPGELVSELAKSSVLGQQTWQTARANNDYAAFAPVLRQVIDLKQQQARHLCDDGPLYDALLEEYEPGMTSAMVRKSFDELRPPLVRLIDRHRADPDNPAVAMLRRDYPTAGQRHLAHWAAQTIGFDFDRGRLDETTHPFCTTLGPHDVRILTRYETNWLPSGLYGTLHEAGHGMYEQGLAPEQFGLPSGTYASLGIHESQSRLWENQIGRSPGFVDLVARKLRQVFPDHLDIEPSDLHRGVNAVTPSLIRVEADETTYNLHIMIRFDLESALIAGDLSVDDLPAAWNERYRDDLGLDVPDDTRGVLQDVHWAAGLIGYFPTYTIGNVVSAILMNQADKQLGLELNAWSQPEPNIVEQYRSLHRWLSRQVYRDGRIRDTSTIVADVSGGGLDSDPLVDYLTDKHSRN